MPRLPRVGHCVGSRLRWRAGFVERVRVVLVAQEPQRAVQGLTGRRGVGGMAGSLGT